MVSIEHIDQAYFIDIDAYDRFRDDISYLNKGLCDFLFDEISVLDDKYETVVLPEINQYSSLVEWRKFKSDIIAKYNNIETYIGVYLKKVKNILNDSFDENEAKSYWNDSDDDSYPKNKFNSFNDWYESQSYYDWRSEYQGIAWNDFKDENESIYEALKDIEYIDNYDNVFNRNISSVLEDIEKYISTFIIEEEKEINKNIKEKCQEAIVAVFEF